MMYGISKEKLLEIKETAPDGQTKLFIQCLIVMCTELNPWMPIEDAPKDRPIVLSYPELGAHDGCWIVDSWYCELSELTQSTEQPTHWCELRDDLLKGK